MRESKLLRNRKQLLDKQDVKIWFYEKDKILNENESNL